MWRGVGEREDELGFSTLMRFVRSGSTAGRNGLKVVRLRAPPLQQGPGVVAVPLEEVG